MVGENGLTSLLLQYSFHFDKVLSYCFRVPDLQDASMISVTVDEKPLFWSCFRVSGTSVEIVSGEVGVFRLGDWADIMSSRSPAKAPMPERASSLPLPPCLGRPRGYDHNPV